MFLVKNVATGIKFNLKAKNGETIGDSEIYSSKDACLKGIESVRNNCNSHVEDQTIDDFEVLKNPKYEIYLDKKGEFRFRLKARNGEIILSSEGYKSKAGCKNGIESVGKNAPEGEIKIEQEA